MYTFQVPHAAAQPLPVHIPGGKDPFVQEQGRVYIFQDSV